MWRRRERAEALQAVCDMGYHHAVTVRNMCVRRDDCAGIRGWGFYEWKLWIVSCGGVGVKSRRKGMPRG